MSERSDAPIVFSGTTSADSAKNFITERRSQARFPFTASTEIYEVRSRTRVSGRCSDLSTGGCYVDTISAFAVGTAVRIRIDRDQRVFEAEAVVAYAHAQMGMGIAFTGVKPEHRDILRSWIAELSGEAPVEPPEHVTEPQAPNSEGDTKLRLAMNELITLLVRKKVVSESEATALLRAMFR
jgi:hypothetical protein